MNKNKIKEKYKDKILGVRLYPHEKSEFYLSDFLSLDLICPVMGEFYTCESDITPAGKAFIEEYYGFSNLASLLIDKGKLKESISEYNVEELTNWLVNLIPMESLRFINESRGTIAPGQSLNERLNPPDTTI